MCEHISKVLEWGFTDAHDYKVTKYGCLNCDEVSDVPFPSETIAVDHTACGGPEVCFGCKAAGLLLNTGDASSQKQTTNKKWEGELEAYRKARSEGIQPAGTTLKAVQEAQRASDSMGSAYDATTMPDTNIIQNKTVSKLKEVGAI